MLLLAGAGTSASSCSVPPGIVVNEDRRAGGLCQLSVAASPRWEGIGGEVGGFSINGQAHTQEHCLESDGLLLLRVLYAGTDSRLPKRHVHHWQAQRVQP